jgi:hypothetical protein
VSLTKMPSCKQDTQESEEVLDQPIGFGKHKALSWKEVLEEDIYYAIWMINSFNFERIPDGNVIVEALLEEIKSRPTLNRRRRVQTPRARAERSRAELSVRAERSNRLRAILEARQFYVKNDGTTVHIINDE